MSCCEDEFCTNLTNITGKVVYQPRYMVNCFGKVYMKGYDTIAELEEELTKAAEKTLKHLTGNLSSRYLLSRPLHGHVKVTCTWCNSWTVFDLLANLDMLHFVSGKGTTR